MVLSPGNVDDDLLIFAREDESNTPIFRAESKNKRAWRILVVDDDQAIHDITRIALKGFSFGGRDIISVDGYAVYLVLSE